MRNARLLALLAAGICTIATRPAAADVTWDFQETALADNNGNPLPVTPGLGPQLTVSDAIFLSGALNFQATNVGGSGCAPTGPTNFTFYGVAGTEFCNPINIYNVSFGFAFSRNGDISSTSVSFHDEFTDLGMSGSGSEASGQVDTDLDDLGCNPDSPPCTFTGDWVLASSLPVPEPSSLPLLLAALFGAGVARALFSLGSRNQESPT